MEAAGFYLMQFGKVQDVFKQPRAPETWFFQAQYKRKQERGHTATFKMHLTDRDYKYTLNNSFSIVQQLHRKACEKEEMRVYH